MIKEAVEILLGGQTYRLRYDLNALVALEDAFGVSALGLFDRLFSVTPEDQEAIREGRMTDADLSKKIRVSDLRTLLWAGLIHDRPALTREEVGALITLDALPEVVTRCIEALSASFRASTPEGQKKAQGAEPKPRIPRHRTR